MKQIFLGMILLFTFTFFGTASTMKNDVIKRSCIEKREAADMALNSMVLLQTIVKGYVYHGSKNGGTVLDKNMKHSLKLLDQMVVKFSTFKSKDAAVQMCLDILPIGVMELKDMIKEKSNIGNDQLMVDLATVITQAVIGITKGVENDLIAYKADSKPLNSLLSSL